MSKILVIDDEVQIRSLLARMLNFIVNNKNFTHNLLQGCSQTVGDTIA